MVGAPKQLSDLAKIEAALHVRCRSCRRERVYDQALLERDLHGRGWNTTWSELPRALPCRCGSTDVSVLPVPYAGEVLDRTMRPAQRVLVEIAMAVLAEAVQRRAASDDLPVRLALRVLLPHVEARRVLIGMWRSWQMDNPMVRAQSCSGSLEEIRAELRMLGRWSD